MFAIRNGIKSRIPFRSSRIPVRIPKQFCKRESGYRFTGLEQNSANRIQDNYAWCENVCKDHCMKICIESCINEHPDFCAKYCVDECYHLGPITYKDPMFSEPLL
jgi:hypothetical protein